MIWFSNDRIYNADHRNTDTYTFVTFFFAEYKIVAYTFSFYLLWSKKKIRERNPSV